MPGLKKKEKASKGKTDANAVIFGTLTRMSELLNSTKISQEKVAGTNGKPVKSAGTVVRNTMQELKLLAQKVRATSLAQTKSM